MAFMHPSQGSRHTSTTFNSLWDKLKELSREWRKRIYCSQWMADENREQVSAPQQVRVATYSCRTPSKAQILIKRFWLLLISFRIKEQRLRDKISSRKTKPGMKDVCIKYNKSPPSPLLFSNNCMAIQKWGKTAPHDKVPPLPSIHRKQKT